MDHTLDDDDGDDSIHSIKSSPSFIFTCRFFYYYCIPLNLLPSSHLYSTAITEDNAPFIPQILEQLLLLTKTSRGINDECISEPFIKLLRTLCSWRHLNRSNWIDQGLVKEYIKRGASPPFDPELVQGDVFNLDARQRISILATLCDWLLRSSDVLRASVIDYGPVLRLQSLNDIAIDDSFYYIMEDARLYSQSDDMGKGDVWNSEWRAVATNNDEYEAFMNDLRQRVESMKGKQRKNAQALLDSIQTEYGEWIEVALREQERRMRRSVKRREGSPLKSREGHVDTYYTSYYPEGVTKRSSRLAEKEVRLRSEREARVVEERQRETDRLRSLREEQSREVQISGSDNPTDISMSDREKRMLLRKEKRIIEEAKEVEIAAIEAEYMRRMEEERENETRHEGSPKIRIILKTSAQEETRHDQVDSTENVDATTTPANPSPSELTPIRDSHPSQPPASPLMMGDARLLMEFVDELHPVDLGLNGEEAGQRNAEYDNK